MTEILFSGGLESTALIHYYNKNVLLLYIKEGFKRESIEYKNALKAAKFYGVPLESVEIKGLSLLNKDKIKSVKDNVIPVRNLFLLTIGIFIDYRDKIFRSKRNKTYCYGAYGRRISR